MQTQIEQEPPAWWSREVNHDNVEATVYRDGSGPSFCLRAPGAEEFGINERLEAQRKRYGQARTTNRCCVVTDKSATRLHFKRGCGHLKIDGDLGRSHYPQAWASGFLPLIPMERFWAWFNTDGHPRDLFEYKAPRMADDPDAAVACAEAYLLLLGHGWSHGFVIQTTSIQGYHRILSAAGYDMTPKEVRACLDGLVEKGWFSVDHRAISKDGMGYASKRARRYQVKEMYHILDTDLYDRDEYEKRQAFYVSLLERFAPFLKVPSLEGYDTTPRVQVQRVLC